MEWGGTAGPETVRLAATVDADEARVEMAGMAAAAAAEEEADLESMLRKPGIQHRRVWARSTSSPSPSDDHCTTPRTATAAVASEMVTVAASMAMVAAMAMVMGVSKEVPSAEAETARVGERVTLMVVRMEAGQVAAPMVVAQSVVERMAREALRAGPSEAE